MNEFYEIADDGTEPQNEYALKNFGDRIFSMAVGRRERGDFGQHVYKSTRIDRPVVKEDYDNSFGYKILRTSPPYEADKLLDYHFSFFVSKNGKKDAEKFIKHIRYVILPEIQKRDSKKVYTEIVSNWIEDKAKKSSNFFDSDLLELKSNFFGLGINLNELLKKLFKKNRD
jgi:hypothetical protein